MVPSGWHHPTRPAARVQEPKPLRAGWDAVASRENPFGRVGPRARSGQSRPRHGSAGIGAGLGRACGSREAAFRARVFWSKSWSRRVRTNSKHDLPAATTAISWVAPVIRCRAIRRIYAAVR